MRAEFLKIRSLPTPLWIGIVLSVAFLIGIVFSVLKGVGQDHAVLELAIGFPTSIASLVFGSWLVGLEFGQGTLRRVLGSDPRRMRLIWSKFIVALVTVVSVTVALWLLGMVIFSFAGAGHETLIHLDEALRIGAATLLTNVVYMTAAMGLAWITRSMGGGMMIAFVFFFVIDLALLLVTAIRDYTLGSGLGTLNGAIRGDEVGVFEVVGATSEGVAALTVAGWLIVIFGLGVLRTKMTEVR